MKRKRIRIVNKFRFTVFMTTLVLGLFLVLGTITNLFTAYSSNYSEFYELTVKSGDTLWQIAKENNLHNYDVRKMVYVIMETNDMDTAEITPGDIIKIPVN